MTPDDLPRGAPDAPGPCARLACAVGGLLLCLLALWAGPAHAFPFVYVANRGNNTVSVPDTVTNTVVATVPVGNAPRGIAAVPGRAHVANSAGNSVSVVDTSTDSVVATVPVGSSPGAVAVGSGFVYVANRARLTDVRILRIDLLPVGKWRLGGTDRSFYSSSSHANRYAVP